MLFAAGFTKKSIVNDTVSCYLLFEIIVKIPNIDLFTFMETTIGAITRGCYMKFYQSCCQIPRRLWGYFICNVYTYYLRHGFFLYSK